MVKPFIYNSSKEKSDELLKSLEKIGLERKKVLNSEKEERWKLSCIWKEETISLVWEKSWCADGEILEDSSLSIFINTLKTRIDIKPLLDEKLARPIREIITERIKEVLIKYTGKA
jgi:hypothetical protein